MGHQSDDQYSEQEKQQRLEAILRGAFAGPPTPLKDIPTRAGESRQLKRPTDTPTSSPTQKPQRLKRKVRSS